MKKKENEENNKENEQKKEIFNDNKELYIKHLMNEITKYSTCAKSYKNENEDLKEKVKFLITKMAIKDKKIEEITNSLLLKKNPEEENKVIVEKTLNFEVFHMKI